MNKRATVSASIFMSGVILVAPYCIWRHYYRQTRVEKWPAIAPVAVADAALAPLFVAPDALPAYPLRKRNTGILGQEMASPQVTKQRDLLVRTWKRAARLTLALSAADAKPFGPALSTTIRGLTRTSLVDEWGQPFCVDGDGQTFIFVSSGGRGKPDCTKAFVKTIRRASASFNDNRLHKVWRSYVAVQRVKGARGFSRKPVSGLGPGS